MMPTQKAKELAEWAIKYGASKEVSKLFATRIVNEIINNSLEYMGCEPEEGEIIYWQEVKQEIEKL